MRRSFETVLSILHDNDVKHDRYMEEAISHYYDLYQAYWKAPHGEELIRADAKLDAMLDLFNLWCDMIEADRKDPLGDLVEYKYPRPAAPEQLSEQEDK